MIPKTDQRYIVIKTGDSNREGVHWTVYRRVHESKAERVANYARQCGYETRVLSQLNHSSVYENAPSLDKDYLYLPTSLARLPAIGNERRGAK